MNITKSVRSAVPWGPKAALGVNRSKGSQGIKGDNNSLGFSELRNLSWPFVDLKIQNLYDLAPKFGREASMSIISTHPKFSFSKCFDLAGLIFLITSMKMGFYLFIYLFKYSLYVLCILAYF